MDAFNEAGMGRVFRLALSVSSVTHGAYVERTRGAPAA
jgi:hypothetical protein